MKKLLLSAGFSIAIAGYAQGQTTATQVSANESATKNVTTTAALPVDVKTTKAKKNRKAAKATEAVPQDVKITIPTSVVDYKEGIPASAKKD